MKLGRNPETHEILDTERVLPPMEVNLDASVYAEVPDKPESLDGSSDASDTGESDASDGSGASAGPDATAGSGASAGAGEHRVPLVLPVLIIILILTVLLETFALVRARKRPE